MLELILPFRKKFAENFPMVPGSRVPLWAADFGP